MKGVADLQWMWFGDVEYEDQNKRKVDGYA
jgi:hypothetical protein